MAELAALLYTGVHVAMGSLFLLASLAGSRTHSQAPAQQEMELADNFLGESSLSSLVPTSPREIT